MTIPVLLPLSLQMWMNVRNMGMPSVAHGGARTAWAPTVVSWVASLASTGHPWVTALVSSACVPIPFLAGTTCLWNIFARDVKKKKEEEEACGQWGGR